MLKQSVLALVSGVAPAVASSPESWAAMDKRVTRACIAMSGLARPQVMAKKMSFSDTIGIEARMIRGTDDRGRMQRKLCAFNRRTGRTEVQDAGGWLGATTGP